MKTNPDALAALVVEVLRDIRTHHYEPQFGGYCWCQQKRQDVRVSHSTECLQIKSLFKVAEEMANE